MTVYRFEDLRVWQWAKKQQDDVGMLIRRGGAGVDRDWADQIGAASLSVMNNVSEGFLRHRDPEFLQFLRYAAGSNGEVRSCLYAGLGRRYLDDSEFDTLVAQSNSIGKMIRRLADTLDPNPSPARGSETRGRRPKTEGPPKA
jgi:four helix bundle protein